MEGGGKGAGMWRDRSLSRIVGRESSSWRVVAAAEENAKAEMVRREGRGKSRMQQGGCSNKVRDTRPVLAMAAIAIFVDETERALAYNTTSILCFLDRKSVV